MSETLFQELKRYVGFDVDDEATLHAAHAELAPHFGRISETFYDVILQHEGARKALVGGESAVGHLKVTLVAWMDTLLRGPWDEAYYERRAKIGRLHVRINLPQHYMFGAMNVMRSEFIAAVIASVPEARRPRTARSLHKIFDLELAIMLHTYREDLLAQQARGERLSTFGQLVGSIGHELRNPLGIIESSLYILKGKAGSEPVVQKHLQRIGDQVEAANEIISNLLDMIRDRPLERVPVPLAEPVQQAVASLQVPEGVHVELRGLEALGAVSGDATQLRQVFTNLVENAIQALGAAGEVLIEGERAGPRLRVSVEDSGPGVADSVRARLFEPLMTTKVKGIGLGLPLVKRIVERHGGSIVYAPRGRGARFVVELPAV